ncbi:uncharacterized protein LOC141911719 isoform X2 [Tubulanus polymorphus]|uniref:uncharacterized protein LOC141911719 isoform X2 n=1 Tax=Tubulanus polymorphus TaxID=672921 RepID=UPI003DA2ECCC
MEEEENEETLDPRVKDELEVLNHASIEINHLELELDEARSGFRQVLTEATQKLNNLASKLGSCIDKARPYYEARIKAKEAQSETQKAALRFERSCSMQTAAKEMVNLAEQGFLRKGQPFDPAWQEMLNHATMKVNEAEIERIDSELEHQRTATLFNNAEQNVKHLHKELKRSIQKSRPYFEAKSNFNQIMEQQKQNVERLETQVTKAKKSYASALHTLESISDEIHRQRSESQTRRELGQRSSGVGCDAPAPPPASESPRSPASRNRANAMQSESTQTESSDEEISARPKRLSLNTGVVDPTLTIDPTLRVNQRDLDLETEEYHYLPDQTNRRCLMKTSKSESNLDSNRAMVLSGAAVSYISLYDDKKWKNVLKDYKTLPNTYCVNRGDTPTRDGGVKLISHGGDTVQSADDWSSHLTRTTATQMTSPDDSSVTSPRDSVDDTEFSDSESVCSSQPVLDDEQLNHLMLEPRIASPSDHGVGADAVSKNVVDERWKKGMTLPAKLRHLESYLEKYQTEWAVDKIDDFSTGRRHSQQADGGNNSDS